MTNEEAIKHINAAAKLAIDAGYSSDIVDACALAVRALEREAKAGHWINIKDTLWNGGGYWQCSNCKYGFAYDMYFECDEWKYCPNCGARMEG